jgi:pyruvate dehydrogenase E1 component alpha subunit
MYATGSKAMTLGSLANPDHHTAPITDGRGDLEAHVPALRSMILIRCAEEKIGEMVASGVVKCPCHLAIGQEASAAGVAEHLRITDRIFGAHRSHAHYLADGGSLRGLMAEVQGKVTGASRGMGGSMHLIDLAHGLMGTVPIVGATIPIAVGAGLAARMDGRGDIAVSFFGDGATEEGVFHESMNLAAVLPAPVLFVCENNLFSSHLHISLRQPDDSVSRYAVAHWIEWQRVDGNDIAAVSAAVREAVTEMRVDGHPRFLELVTYRWRGHVGPREDEDVGVKRADDLKKWKQRDPIRRLAEALVTAGILTETNIAAYWEEIRAEVESAWTQASKDPFPTSTAVMDCVYTHAPTDGKWRGR